MFDVGDGHKLAGSSAKMLSSPMRIMQSMQMLMTLSFLMRMVMVSTETLTSAIVLKSAKKTLSLLLLAKRTLMI